MFSEVLPAQWLTEKLCIFIPYCCQNWRHQCQELFLHLVGNAMLINTNVYSDLHMSSQKGSFVIAFLGTSSPTLFTKLVSIVFSRNQISKNFIVFSRNQISKNFMLFTMEPIWTPQKSPKLWSCVAKNKQMIRPQKSSIKLFPKFYYLII